MSNPAVAQLPQLLRPAEAARRLAIDSRTLAGLARDGELPYHRVGGMTRYDAADLAEWLRRTKRNKHALD